MVSFSVDFAPLTAWWLLALVCLPAIALIAWAVVSRTRGAVVRAGAAAALARSSLRYHAVSHVVLP